MSQTDLATHIKDEQVNDYEIERTKADPDKKPYKKEVLWANVFVMILVHVWAVAGFMYVAHKLPTATVWLFAPFQIVSALGIQAGVHMLWTHRSYKARLPLRIFLMIAHTTTLQKDIYDWARDHRVHHKFSETDADPHNANRGWFFAHMGWLMCKKHPDVRRKGKNVDLSDLLADPVVYYQRKFYVPLALIFWGYIPTAIFYYYGGATQEGWFFAFTCNLFRTLFVNHLTWLINSSAHIFGSHPYDKTIGPTENLTVNYFTFGGGYHNYHHTFPWDYVSKTFNPSAMFVDFFSWMDQAYDLKRASPELIEKRISRTGDRKQTIKPESGAWDTLLGFCHWFCLFPLSLLPRFVYNTILEG